jgi:hypothetical protein
VAIVYKKGAVVLDMLARFLQQEYFLEILRSLVEVVSFRPISTEEFVTIIGRLSGTPLDAFAQQYIFATGLPKVYYTYDFEPTAAGKFLVTGVARQESPWCRRCRVVQHEDGGMEVACERVDQADAASSNLAVPMQIAIYDPGVGTGNTDRRHRLEAKVLGNSTLTGRLLLKGELSEIQLELDHEPRELWLDRNKEVFALFFNERRHPKRALYHRGEDLASAGDYAAAEAAYRRGLAAEVLVGPSYQRLEGDDDKVEARFLDTGIQMGLARIFLDQNRTVDARGAVEEARRLLTGSSPAWLVRRLEVLEGRLAIRCKDFEQAYKLLRKTIKRGNKSTEAMLLFAIAAHASGHAEDFDLVLAKARGKVPL